MRGMTTIAAVVAALTLWMSGAAAVNDYSWSLSASSTDPSQNTAAPSGTATSLNVFLWLSAVNPALGAGAMECAIQITGFFPGTFTALNGALATGAPDLLLAIPCATVPTLLGQQNVLDLGTGGTVCMGASSNGNNVTVDCDPLDPQLHPHTVTGFSSNGSAPCMVDTPVEPATWGGVKALYR